MFILKNINLLLRLLLELGVLLSIGYWGFRLKGSTLRFGVGIGGPIIVMVVWGMFIAPNSAYQLPLPWRIIMEIIIFGLGAYALYASGRQALAKIFSILAIVNMVLLLYWKQ